LWSRSCQYTLNIDKDTYPHPDKRYKQLNQLIWKSSTNPIPKEATSIT
jgi:hypothetical protein